MSRNTQYQFISTDTNALVSALVSGYEKITGVSVQPASPEKLFIQWVADIIIQERVQNNYTGNQNIPSRASGENLDALGELFYVSERPTAQPAVCNERFYISEARATAILIPAGTRVTDSSSTLVWETVEDVYVDIGDTYADVQIRCQTPGVVGNDYAVGQINTIIDLFDYYSRCENTTASDSGSDEATDGEFYELMRASTWATEAAKAAMLSSFRKTSGSARRRFSAVRACALFILIPPIRGGDVAYRRHLGRVLLAPVLEDGKGGRGKVHPLDAGLHEQANQVGRVDVPPQLAALPGHILLHRRVHGGLDFR